MIVDLLDVMSLFRPKVMKRFVQGRPFVEDRREIEMRVTLMAAATAMMLLTAPSHAQEGPGSQGLSSPDGASGSAGKSRGKGHRGSAQNTEQQQPKADEKAYRSAIDSLPDKKFDPWHDVR
jgi:hypothetical protein